MAFLLKKIVGLLLQPLTIVLVLLVAGWVFLLRDRFRPARILVGSGIVLLLLISLQYVPFLIGRSLESRFPAYDRSPEDEAPRFVVVLGGGVREDASLPLSARLSPTALARVVEGVRIVQQHPEAALIVTGGQVFSSVSEADVAAEVAAMLGVEKGRIIRESQSRDTAQQARLVGQMVGDARFVLVTSAVHMPRSLALFRGQGMTPVPAPTAHLFDGRLSGGPRLFLPTAENIRYLEQVMHEIYGMAWAALRGLI